MAAVGTVGAGCAIGVEAVVRNVHPRQRIYSRAFARLEQFECNLVQAIGWFLPMGIETSYSETTRDPFCLNIMITWVRLMIDPPRRDRKSLVQD